MTRPPAGTRAREHPFVRGLHRALVEDVHADIQLALKVGTLLAGGFSRAEVARLTNAEPAELRAAYARLERIAPSLDRDADPA